MVPSDPRSSLLPSRHARPERGFETPGPRPLCSPPSPLAATDQRAGGRPRHVVPKEPATRSGLSLAWCGCSFPSHLARVIVSGLPLRRLVAPFLDPFGSGLPSSVRVVRSGEVHCPQPVAEATVLQSRSLFGPCSPAGPRDPLGSSLVPIQRREAHLSFAPRLSSLPGGEEWVPSPPDHRSDRLTRSQARWLREPLGTNTIMPQVSPAVKGKRRREARFPQILSSEESDR